MREAMIICPVNDNEGKSLQHVKHYAELALCKAFGGCTTSKAHGSWVNPDTGELKQEPVYSLMVACDPSTENARKLESIARYIGHEGKQHSVYVRYASGDVAFIETENHPHVIAA